MRSRSASKRRGPRQLREDRQQPRHHGRAALRSRRSARRPQGPRCSDRQRQHCPLRRRGCEVTGMDYVPEWVEYARKRAEAEQMEVAFELGEAENLPYPGATFDAVLSTLGVMFAPNQEKPRASCLGCAGPEARSDSPTGHPTVSSAISSAPSANTSRRLPVYSRRSRGASKSGCVNSSAEASPRSKRGGAATCSGICREGPYRALPRLLRSDAHGIRVAR